MEFALKDQLPLAARIRDDIASGAIAFGTPITESFLTAKYGYAGQDAESELKALRAMGLLEPFDDGLRVIVPTFEMVREFTEFRFVLERDALERAMKRSADELIERLEECQRSMLRAMRFKRIMDAAYWDGQFHRAFFNLAGNATLMQVYLGAAALVDGLRSTVINALPDSNDKAVKEHEALITALRAGQVEQAVEILGFHVRRVVRRFSEIVVDQ